MKKEMKKIKKKVKNKESKRIRNLSILLVILVILLIFFCFVYYDSLKKEQGEKEKGNIFSSSLNNLKDFFSLDWLIGKQEIPLTAFSESCNITTILKPYTIYSHGDSISAANYWQPYLDSYMGSNISALNSSGGKVYIFAVNGWTCELVSNDFNKSIKNNSVAIILCGINADWDMANAPRAEVAYNKFYMEQIQKQAIVKNVSLIWISVLTATADSLVDTQLPSRIFQINEWLRTNLTVRYNTKYVDAHRKIWNGTYGFCRTDYCWTDGLHPINQGNVEIAKVIWSQGFGNQTFGSQINYTIICPDGQTCSNGACVDSGSCVTRDAYKQPFNSTSIWNMPIGSNAVYVPGKIPPHDYTSADEDVIVLTPTAPLRQVWTNNVGWSLGNRCIETTYDGFSVPIPDNFIIGDERPSTPNYAAAFLLPNNRTIVQFQPVARCNFAGNVTYEATDRFPDVDIYGAGIEGAHGGAGLSSIGGTIRLGELVPGAPPMKHALKIALQGFSTSSSGTGYRWPAVKADSCAPGCYTGTVPELKMGALLALLPSFNISKLKTEPARRIAWTLQNYGAYHVDSSGWSSYYFMTEKSPDGDVFTEFADSWGFTMTGINTSVWNRNIDDYCIANTATDWGRDMLAIFGNLSVVNNNAANSIGGGGTPLQSLAPDLNSNCTSNCIKGDINCDSIVDIKDLILVAKAIGTSGCNSGNNWCDKKDVNTDGNVGLTDIINVAKKI